MESKKQEYLSVVFRNTGFGLFAPLCSIIFQWLVFKKELSEGHFSFSAIVFVLGILFIFLGYIMLNEKGKK